MDCTACWDVSVNTALCTQVSNNKWPCDLGDKGQKNDTSGEQKYCKNQAKTNDITIGRFAFSKEIVYEQIMYKTQ